MYAYIHAYVYACNETGSSGVSVHIRSELSDSCAFSSAACESKNMTIFTCFDSCACASAYVQSLIVRAVCMMCRIDMYMLYACAGVCVLCYIYVQAALMLLLLYSPQHKRQHDDVDDTSTTARLPHRQQHASGCAVGAYAWPFELQSQIISNVIHVTFEVGRQYDHGNCNTLFD